VPSPIIPVRLSADFLSAGGDALLAWEVLHAQVRQT